MQGWTLQTYVHLENFVKGNLNGCAMKMRTNLYARRRWRKVYTLSSDNNSYFYKLSAIWSALSYETRWVKDLWERDIDGFTKSSPKSLVRFFFLIF